MLWNMPWNTKICLQMYFVLKPWQKAQAEYLRKCGIYTLLHKGTSTNFLFKGIQRGNADVRAASGPRVLLDWKYEVSADD